MAASLEAIYMFGDAGSSVRPFLRGGGGLHARRYDPGDIETPANTSVRPGFSAGAGASVLAGSVDVLAGARFTSAPDGGSLGFYIGVALPLR